MQMFLLEITHEGLSHIFARYSQRITLLIALAAIQKEMFVYIMSLKVLYISKVNLMHLTKK